MYSKTTVVSNPSGLHARPAAVFAKQASAYESKVTIANVTKGGAAGDAKSMLAIMMLAAKPGDEVEISAEGYTPLTALHIAMFSGVPTMLPVALTPLKENQSFAPTDLTATGAPQTLDPALPENP